MSDSFDLPDIRLHRDQMSDTINSLTARWSRTLEEMYRSERRIVELEAELAEVKTLLRGVQVYPTRDEHPVWGGIHFYRSASAPPDFGDRRDALLNSTNA